MGILKKATEDINSSSELHRRNESTYKDRVQLFSLVGTQLSEKQQKEKQYSGKNCRSV